MRFCTGSPAVAVAGSLALLASVSDSCADVPPKWGASLDVEGKLGTKRNLGEADAFVPLWQDDRTLVFGNAKFRMDDNQSHEGNLGLGVRHMHESGWNLGLYGYGDRRRSPIGNIFHQATVGAEALGRDVDVRVNGYLPVGRTVHQENGLETWSISDTQVIFRGGEERALGGWDAEAGWRVPLVEFESPYDFRVYGGIYQFKDDDVPEVSGPRLRAEFSAYELPYLPNGTRLTLGAEWQHDAPRGSQGFLSARLRIPLQSERQRSRALTAQERRMTAPVVRDVDIVTQAGALGAPERATTADGNTLVVLSSDVSGDGSLTDEFAAAGENATVIVAGTINTTVISIVRGGQTLMGAGSVSVRTPSGRAVTLTMPGGTINSEFVKDALRGAANSDNVTITGITLNHTSTGNGSGIFFVTGDGWTISNNTINVTGTGGTVRGIDFSFGSATITGNTITATSPGTGEAISVGSGSTVTIAGNTLSASHNYLNLGSITTINAGSTGNVAVSGACATDFGVNGSVGFTDGTTCP